MIQIKVSYIDHLLDQLAIFNKLDITEVEFLDDDGNVIEIGQEVKEHFELVGLANQDFVSVRYWENWEKTSLC